jgi:hypothetical protein
VLCTFNVDQGINNDEQRHKVEQNKAEEETLPELGNVNLIRPCLVLAPFQ